MLSSKKRSLEKNSIGIPSDYSSAISVNSSSTSTTAYSREVEMYMRNPNVIKISRSNNKKQKNNSLENKNKQVQESDQQLTLAEQFAESTMKTNNLFKELQSENGRLENSKRKIEGEKVEGDKKLKEYTDKNNELLELLKKKESENTRLINGSKEFIEKNEKLNSSFKELKKENNDLKLKSENFSEENKRLNNENSNAKKSYDILLNKYKECYQYVNHCKIRCVEMEDKLKKLTELYQNAAKVSKEFTNFYQQESLRNQPLINSSNIPEENSQQINVASTCLVNSAPRLNATSVMPCVSSDVIAVGISAQATTSLLLPMGAFSHSKIQAATQAMYSLPNQATFNAISIPQNASPQVEAEAEEGKEEESDASDSDDIANEEKEVDGFDNSECEDENKQNGNQNEGGNGITVITASQLNTPSKDNARTYGFGLPSIFDQELLGNLISTSTLHNHASSFTPFRANSPALPPNSMTHNAQNSYRSNLSSSPSTYLNFSSFPNFNHGNQSR